MRILITGATGFIGRHVVNAIQSDENKLALLVRNVSTDLHLKATNAILLSGSLSDIGAVKESIKEFAPEACIHLAWQGIPDYSAGISKLNLHQSIELIDFLSTETECKKIIVSGSCFEYGKTQGECNESDCVITTSFFAWAKQSVYNYYTLLCEQSLIDLIWFRIFYVYGPGQRTGALIPALTQAFFRGEQPNVRSPFDSNDFVYIEDLANAFQLALEKDIASGIYNLGSGKAHSVLEVCRIVEQQVSGSTNFSDHFPEQNTPQGHVCFWSNIAKSRRIFGWEPKYSLKAGIQRYMESLQPTV